MVTAELRSAIAGLAREAGRATMVYYDGTSDAGVREKADRSPVTLADEVAHGIILEGLGRLDPETPVVSEESAAASSEVRRGWRRFWLVDPLDGTKEFIKRRAEFTVNIALIENGEPVLGVVLAPALDLLYWAVKGGGAWRETGAAPAERIHSSAAAPGTPLTVVESLSHPSPELEEYLKTVPVARRVKAGSSLKFCWVAEGRADIYPRLGPTMEWDVAAGDCVYRQSAMQGERASPLTYNKPDLRNPSFVIGL
ncbi:MAG TPA: 3'(2'),5'-bisphosphate nucleotidase CysQ [Gemmatimonadales bacterium]|jgi:3'(2'), 5'-bisphosphate nucleotidase|nr:3'(2'),5'-bisphosphate nucleotidase CysQ [Gemmatimonadales bacterium]